MVDSDGHIGTPVTVEGTRLTVGGVVFETTDISSARTARVPAASSGPVLMTVVGAFCLLSAAGEAGATGFGIGVALIVAAGVWWTQKKPSFELRLATGSETVVPLASRDEAEIDRAAAAVNEALAVRTHA